MTGHILGAPSPWLIQIGWYADGYPSPFGKRPCSEMRTIPGKLIGHSTTPTAKAPQGLLDISLQFIKQTPEA